MYQPQTTKNEINTARSKFLSMAATYCLGVFNDNFFKQAALLLAVTTGMGHLQGPATILFSLPFILFSAYAGWVADRFSKKSVVISSKVLELIAMAIGATGIIFSNWPCILAMVFLMGLQSTFFSPALNGSIPELYPESYVAKANGILKLCTTLAILAGIAAAGVTLDASWPAHYNLPTGGSLLAVLVIVTALAGLVASLGVFSKPAASTSKSFPKYGPLNSLFDTYSICKDRQLLIAIFSDTYFYFVSSIAILTINTFGLKQLGLSQTLTSILSVFLMLGVSFGALVISRIVDMKQWKKFLLPSSFGMALGLFLSAVTIYFPENLQKIWLISSLTFVGFSGGAFLIPVTSFLQVYPDRQNKGQVLAATNFCGFIGILCSGFVFSLLLAFFQPFVIMATIGLFCLFSTIILSILKGDLRTMFFKITGAIVRLLLSLRYKVEVTGLDAIEKRPDQGTLFLPNHPALIDPVLVMTNLYRKFTPRPLSDEAQANMPVVKHVMKLIRPITIPDINTDGRSGLKKVFAALKKITTSLNNNDDIIFYPAGRIYRSSNESLAGNSGVEYILNNTTDARIVLVRTTGLWGSSFGRANQNTPSIIKQIIPTIKFLIANFLFFGPKRQITIEFVEDTQIRTLKDRDQINSYLEQFYNHKPLPNTTIPTYWWQGSSPVILPEPIKAKFQGDISQIPATNRELVQTKLEDLAGKSVTPTDKLATDLAMDSLTVMEFTTWLEEEFGHQISDLASLESVEDCILASGGQLLENSEEELKKIPDQWFNNSDTKLVLPEKELLTDLFLQQAIKHPKKVIVADQIAGCKTYRDLLTAIYLLKPVIKELPGKRVGIMLPASVTSVIVYFATLFSGKTPVLFNWTVGVGNMAHGIEQTGVTHIISAKPLYKKVEEQGAPLSSLQTDWLFLDQLLPTIPLPKKIFALTRAILSPKAILNETIQDIAAILFTSGSESKPKAVPLRHSNILANLRDFTSMMTLTENDSLLGMLPPFHSLGLAGTVILPPCIGLRTVYHANPTESVILSKLISRYKPTTIIGTPTFINGILQAGDKGKLESLRLVFTGAEKCPESVYNKLCDINPKATLCEGYGITECSPLVSLNTIKNNTPGTIGRVVPSTQYAIIDLESNTPVKRGERGILILRGPSIFGGYLNQDKQKGFHDYQGKVWYQTGDFVREDENGTITFAGRKKRFIKLGGEMISLPAIENVLLERFTHENAEGPALAVEATPSEEYPEIVLFTTNPIQREEANQVIREAGFSPLYNIRKVLQIDVIPVLGTGKTDYKELKASLLKN